MDLYRLLQESTKKEPNNTALFGACGKSMTYSDLLKMVEEVSVKLRDLGIGRNDRVAIVMENGIEMASAFLGVSVCATSAPLNPRYRKKELNFFLKDLQAKLVIVEEELDSPIEEVADELSIPIWKWPEKISRDTKEAKEVDFAKEEDIALVLHTSGTTSRPKIVPLTHQNICSSAKHIRETLALSNKDSCLNVMPLFHIHGLMGCLLSSLSAGASVICTKGFNASLFFDWWSEYRPSWYSAVPTMHQAILQRTEQYKGLIKKHPLRFIRSSSASLPPAVLENLEKKLLAPVIESYGMTEASHQMTSNPLQGKRKPGSVGLSAGPEVAILDPEGEILPFGSIGEISIRGSNVTQGYENNPEANASAFSKGWFRTGDQGFLDSENYLFINGRIKEIINRGGEKISPREVDEVLLEHPSIVQAVSFAFPHEQLGEEIAVAVILEKPIKEREIQEFAALHLADFKIPRKVVIVEEIPKGPTGKLQRIGLAEKLGVSFSEEKNPVEVQRVAPQTKEQEQLWQIWSKILRLENFGIHDNFFLLGGDSILVNQVIIRVLSEMGKHLSFLDFFNQPTIAEISLLWKEKKEEKTLPPIVPSFSSLKKSISGAQERLWFLHQLNPDLTIYNRLLFLSLNGPLNLSFLERSLRDIVHKHEILRTIYQMENGPLEPSLLEENYFFLEEEDFSHLRVDEQESLVSKTAQEESQRTFDLSKGPIITAKVVILEKEKHILFLTIHHIAFDGWSESVFLREMAKAYTFYEEETLSKETISLEKLPFQYKDFASWQNKVMAGDMKNHIHYWTKQLANLTTLDLPNDLARPSSLSYQGKIKNFRLSLALSQKIKEVGQKEQATLFMSLLAGFQAFLHRYSGQRDIAVGVPVANRRQSEVENLIGCFINPLVIRVHPEKEDSYLDILKKTRRVVMEAQEYQDLPFERVVNQLQPKRDLSRHPLFQVLFQLRNYPKQKVSLGNCSIESFPFSSSNTDLDLMFDVIEEKEGLLCFWKYNSDLFSENLIERMVEHFQVLLERMVSSPNKKVNSLPIITDEEKHKIAEWNKTETDYSKNKTIHQIFEEQAEKTPQAIALSMESRTLSYRQLNEKANQLAHTLREEQVFPEKTVGILMNRSVDLIVSMLATLKAGGAYVPIDPEYPLERIKYIIEKTGIDVILAPSLQKKNWASLAPKMLFLDEINLSSRLENLSLLSCPRNLAYVIFTSGSTGKPKGIGVEHQSVVRLVQKTNYISIHSDDVLGYAGSPSFDVSTFEIWGSLLNGAKLVIISQDNLLNPEQFAKILREEKVSILWLMAGLCNLFVEQKISVFESLKCLLVGGEKLSFAHMNKIRQKYPNISIINGYGPTENTTFSTTFSIDKIFAKNIPIGKPIANSQAYVLNDNFEHTPVGAVGEIWVSGDGVARGYHNDPARTAERFLPHPFSQKQGARMYKTGDLGRYLSDGNIEFLDRADHQVKVRGFRIECGEIENCLSQHPLVNDAAVVVIERNQEKTLVAFFTGSDVSIEELNLHLQKHLPDYMIPSRIAFLESFPFNTNGKIDRRALVEEAQSYEPKTSSKFSLPATPQEQILLEIWENILGLEKISVHDSFFSLGGSSLLVTKMAHQVQKTIGKEIPLHLVFQFPTIAELAKCLRLDDNEIENIPRVTQEKYPLSLAQQRLWFLTKLEPESPFYNVSLTKILVGKLNTDNLKIAFEAILQHQESLRTQFVEAEGVPYQEIISKKDGSFSYQDLTVYGLPEREQRIEKILSEETQKTFLLGEAPLIRPMLIKWQEEKHVLLLSMHHIITDEWSISILWKEWASFYNALEQGQKLSLSPLPIQYTDFSVWQHQQLKKTVLQEQKEYWINQFSGETPILNLPTYRPRPKKQSYSGARISLSLDNEISQAIRKLAHQENVTTFMVFLASWNILLSRYSGQKDIVVGTPISNRQHNQTDNLIGFFVNILALRIDQSGNPTFFELLQRIRRTCLEAYQHQDYPFELLVEAINPPRDTSRSPLFQVMFSMLEISLDDFAWEGLDIENIPPKVETSKFDLTLFVRREKNQYILNIEYSTCLFERSFIDRMLQHFQVLLHGIVTVPNQKIYALPVFGREEEKQIIQWSETTTNYPKNKAIHELFEEQVKRTPLSIALSMEGKSLNYQDLNEKANHLAYCLMKRKTSPEEAMGILLERSFDMIIGMLAILKTGSAYVPLDPSYPKERIKYLIEESKIETLLTTSSEKEKFSELSSRMVFLDQINYSEKAINLDIDVSPENLAYIIFTSGSTGEPKGVSVEHRSVVRLVKNTNYININSEDIFTHTGAPSFDASTFEIWGALLHGAKLCSVSKESLLAPEKFLQVVQKEKVTVMWLTTGLFNVLSEQKISLFESLKYLIVGGAKLSSRHINKVHQKYPNVKILNGYGPTENTTFSTTFAIEKVFAEDIPIGKAIANSQVYIFNEYLEHVPIGGIGEIWVGGDGLVRSYYNKPHLTAERFLPHPFSKNPGARIYRTGDLGCYLSDGNVKFLGRMDYQVKVRGFRIECGEIENCLFQHSLVKDVVVIASEALEETRLLAFVIGSRVDIDSSILEAYLKKHLPSQMIPNHFIVLESFPLTKNGKIDRKRLKVLAESYSPQSQSRYTPKSVHEEILADIWKEILSLDKVGIDDNFFHLGGHSLLVIKMIHRIQHIMKKEIPVHLIFQFPTIEELANYLELGDHEVEVIPKIEQEKYPLSLVQQRLWFLFKLEPENPSYNIFRAKLLLGRLDVNNLKEAFHVILKRQQSLRTQFFEEEGVSYQKIVSSLDLDLSCLDFTVYANSDRKEKIDEAIDREIKRTFDLKKDPLVRLILIKWEKEKYIFVLTIHHIISDGWSMSILWKELILAYNALLEKEEPIFSPLSIQYSDYSIWQQKLLQQIFFKEHELFWKERFSRTIPTLDLPTYQPRPKIQKYSAGNVYFSFNEKLLTQIKGLSKKNNATMFMVLLTAFHILLNRYSGQKDIVIGIPVVNRDQQELESLVGFFINNLALRINLSQELSFLEALAEVRQVWINAYEHRSYPFERLVEVLNPPRDTSRNPLFQVFFNMLDLEGIEDELKGVVASDYPCSVPFSKFDLTLYLKVKEEVRLHFCYNNTLFKQETIAQMAEHYQNLVKDIIANPQEKISQLEILTEKEKKKILLSTQSNRCNFNEERMIEEMFIAQANKTPQDLAVVYASNSLTYQQLNKQSNQLAHYLIKKGVKEETLVGIVFDNPLTIFVAILATMKTGGVFVPLDPEHPKKRLQLMLEELQLPVILTTKEFQKLFLEEKSEVICLDLEEKIISQESQKDISKRKKEESLAYCLFTSGSTGKPKGVLVEHRHLKNGILAVMKRYQIVEKAEKSGYAVFQPFTVDAGMSLYFPAILTGGKVHLFSRKSLLDPPKLREYFQAEKIDYLKIAPSHLMTLLNFSKEIRPREVLILVAEATSRRSLKEILKIEDCQIYNQYGATETSVGVLVHPVSKKDLQHEFLPLGQPISNVEVFILDENLQIVPSGVTGEICLAGSQVIRGYLNEPELTKEKFVPHPFSQIKNTKLYRTGDMGKYTPEGEIVFLGRKDDIVSIRGFNVACGEVETVLIQYSKIQNATVLPKQNQDKENYLVAYYVLKNPKEELSDNCIREHLRMHLPDYMIPSGWKSMEKLPLTANGKVDRKALDSLKLMPKVSMNGRKPETEIEIKLAQIWEQILKTEGIGICDNFFDLGGHSLLVIKMVHRIQQVLGEQIPIHQVFQSPTIDELVNYLKLGGNKLENIPRVEQSKYPLSLTQQRLWFLTKLEPENPFYNISLAKLFVGKLNIDNLEKAFNIILKRQQSLRTQFKEEEGVPYQEVISFKHHKIPCLDLTIYEESERKEKIEKIICEEPQKTFHIGEAPLIRTMLIKREEEKHIFFFGMHHIISDWWSLKVLWEELTLVYNSLQERKKVDLPPLLIQYTDFSVWQLKQLKGVTLQKQEEYWKNQFLGEILTLDLPTDWSRPKIQDYSGARFSVDLDEKLSLLIEELAHQENATIFMVFLTIWNILLSRYSGQEDVVVGVPIANREHNQTENLIGFFVNTLALRTDLSKNSTFLELLQQVKATCLEAYEHQDYPFEQLVEIINPSRDTSHHPIFQVMINMIESTLELAWEGVEVEKVPLEIETSKFDLTLYIQKKKSNFCLTLEYNRTLFRPSTIERMASHLQVLLKESIHNSHLPITSLNILTEKEKKQFKEEYNLAQREFPKTKTIDQLLEEQIKRTPSDCALIWQKKTMIYRELNAKANQLAHFLMEELGDSKENSFIGICLEHSFELVICTLAVWKTGCAYVPLDPDLPQSRLLFMAKDSRCALILSKEKQQETLSSFSQRTIWVDVDWPKIELFSEENLDIKRNSEDSAYAIYTSGSTGKPKGVEISHSSLINFMTSMEKELGVSSSDRMLAIATFSFDISLLELFLPLLVGAKVVLGSKEISMDGKLLSKCIEENEITKVQGTPTTWRILLAKGWKGSEALTILCGGENLPEDLAKELLSCGKEVWNLYGPTETTVWSSLSKIKNPQEINVGRTISNPLSSVK